MRRIFVILITAVLLLGGCRVQENGINIDDVDFYSSVLEKDMQLKIYLPPGYESGESFPVLYFFPDYGGSAYTVMEQYEAADAAQRLIEEGKIEPLIIAAVDMDRSFGLNSSQKTESYETATGKTFDTGMYEDYFIEEIIPFIDDNYKTQAQKSARYIGGYSMGGFAALYIALNNPEMFAKAGGHSPSIFIEGFYDETVTEFLYPTEELRRARDPIYIVQCVAACDVEFFLDVEAGGASGVEYLYDLMTEKDITAQFHVMGLSHSRATCCENMDEYLLFYAGSDDD